MWWLGIAFSRGYLDPRAFRYQLVGAAFVAVAVVPRVPFQPQDSRLRRLDRRWALAVVLLVAALQGWELHREVSELSGFASQASTLNRGQVVVLARGRSLVPDDRRLSLAMGELTAGEIRALVDRYGNPFPGDSDQWLVDLGVARSDAIDAPGGRECDVVVAPLTVESTTVNQRFIVWARDAAFPIRVRRFGEIWHHLDDLAPGDAVALTLPALSSDEPWEVEASGACRVARGA